MSGSAFIRDGSAKGFFLIKLSRVFLESRKLLHLPREFPVKSSKFKHYLLY